MNLAKIGGGVEDSGLHSGNDTDDNNEENYNYCYCYEKRRGFVGFSLTMQMVEIMLMKYFGHLGEVDVVVVVGEVVDGGAGGGVVVGEGRPEERKVGVEHVCGKDEDDHDDDDNDGDDGGGQ